MPYTFRKFREGDYRGMDGALLFLFSILLLLGAVVHGFTVRSNTLLGLGFLVGSYCFFLTLERLQNKRSEKAFQAFRTAEDAYRDELLRRRRKRDAIEQARKDELRKKMAWWDALNGRSFEVELARLLEKQGYLVELTRASNDGGIDLILRLPPSLPILVQCKAHVVPICVGMVREFFGAIEHFGSNAYSDSWIVSKTSYTYEASQFVKGKRIKLRTIQEFI